MKPRAPSTVLLHINVPHGCYVLKVQYPDAWRAIKYGMIVRGIPFSEKPYHKSMAKTHPTLSEADLLLIVATNPTNIVRMNEISRLLGLTL